MKLQEQLNTYIEENKKIGSLADVTIQLKTSNGGLLKSCNVKDFDFMKDYLSCEVIDFYGDFAESFGEWDSWLVAVLDI